MSLALALAGRRAGLAVTALALAALIASAAPSYGASTISYTNDFEYTPGTVIVDSNGVGIAGWAGQGVATADLAIVVNTNYPYVGDFPLPSAVHSNVMEFSGPISNMFETTQYADPSQLLTNVTIDVMLQAGQISSKQNPGDGVQLALCVDTNGYLMVYHGAYDDSWNYQAPDWTTFTNTSIASGEWVRVTLVMNYLGSGDSKWEHYFTVQLNGGSPLYHPTRGYSNITNVQSVTQGGVNFLTADTGFGIAEAKLGNKFFSGLSLLGVGQVDDLLVSAIVPPPPAGRETLDTWMGHYPELSGQPVNGSGDWDNDGATEYEEYVADTDPTNDKSVFKIVKLNVGASSNLVTWTGTTSSTNVARYRVYRSSDLTQGTNAWTEWAGNVPVDLSGTNIWPDTVGTPTNKAFYIIKSIGK